MVAKNTESIRSEPGRFWIVSERMNFEPSESMEGLLTIADDGQAELELLPESWTMNVPLNDVISGRKITLVGRLRRIEQSVRLADAWLQTLTPLKLKSFVSLIVPCDLSSLIQDQCITRLTIPLENAWPWLGSQMPQPEHQDQNYVVNYPPPYEKSFKISIGTVGVSYSYSALSNLLERELKFERSAEMRIELQNPVTLVQAQSIYLDLEDLLVLLANQQCGLSWSRADILGVGRSGILYCSRRRKIEGTISYLDCWLPYSEIEDVFGSILDEWLKKRLEYGAAFHLYLSTRRGDQLYLEHRFMNFMWGLESLHLKHWPQSLESSETKKARVVHIEKALKGIANSDDMRKIKTALKPKLLLENRLREMFVSLSIGISDESIAVFSKECADLRNEMSHYGGPKNRSNEREFSLRLHELSCAIDPLYHALILSMIGVSSEVIQDIFKRMSNKSFREQAYMKRAGLTFLGDAKRT